MNGLFFFLSLIFFISCSSVHYHIEQDNTLNMSYKVNLKNNFVRVKFKNTSCKVIYFSSDFIKGEIFDINTRGNYSIDSIYSIVGIYYDNTHHSSSISVPVELIKLEPNQVLTKKIHFYYPPKSEIIESMSIVFGFFTKINECRLEKGVGNEKKIYIYSECYYTVEDFYKEFELIIKKS